MLHRNKLNIRKLRTLIKVSLFNVSRPSGSWSSALRARPGGGSRKLHPALKRWATIRPPPGRQTFTESTSSFLSFAHANATSSSDLFWRNLEAFAWPYLSVRHFSFFALRPGRGQTTPDPAAHQQGSEHALTRQDRCGEQLSRDHCAEPGRSPCGAVEPRLRYAANPGASVDHYFGSCH